MKQGRTKKRLEMKFGDIQEPLRNLAHGCKIGQQTRLPGVPCLIMAYRTERSCLLKKSSW
jgi:hypothetical protein